MIQQDTVIIGGGIAGLWLLNRLRQQNKAVILIENNALGGIQSIASQGIIHGGTKYALTGQLSAAAKAIGEMPQRWQDCLQGCGDIDLKAVEISAQHQYLWSTGQLHSNISGFFASKMMKSRMTSIPKSEMPEIFQLSAFKGQLYQLNERVLNPQSLMRVLAEKVKPYCLYQDMIKIEKQSNGFLLSFKNHPSIQVKQLILTAGQGNAGLLKQIGMKQPKQQIRPLQMLMLKGNLFPITAHCLGTSTTPKVTITSAHEQDQTVWYLGGQLAEEGVGLDSKSHIEKGKACLAKNLSWVDISKCQWASFKINRAEVKMDGNKRPSDVFIEKNNHLITAWPTKLALTPRLVDQILDRLDPIANATKDHDFTIQSPPFARLPWQNIQWETP